ncbi:RNA-directed DNA polymerase [Flavobacterium suzhouense]|uniref:RNA-directed DNA polymerase n=1 Tax=Flavobacterium suzhouense TaxID=1529638 RepID=A0ABW5NVK8_9FLAO
MNILNKITDHNNLYWAWLKVKSFYKPGDIWVNELEVAQFELDLSNELGSIHNDIKQGCYSLAPIKPVAFPKSKGDNGPRTRQAFWISVRDQVAWTAVVNIIGRYLDSQMPAWSYGNRLYIAMFYDETLKFGYYRNTNSATYRKWSQSWPLYRRHVNLTTKYMTREADFIEDLDPFEQKIVEINESLSNHPLKSPYLDQNYWKKGTNELYWAGIDLEKFYPSIDNEAIRRNLAAYLPESIISSELMALVNQLLNFTLDYSGWSERELEDVGLKQVNLSFPHVPTGLFVAGFLANVALLEIDELVKRELMENRNIAHFRYVDDHVILATSFDELTAWIKKYEKIIEESGTGVKYNPSKTEPKALAQYLEAQENTDDKLESFEKAKDECRLDPDFPSPLMTKTLSKVSKIAGTAFNLLGPEEEKNVIADVEHLLVTEFPDHELRKDTRVSFAARILTTLVPQIKLDSNEEYRLHKNICLKNIAISKAQRSHDPEVKATAVQLISEKNEYEKSLAIEKKMLSNEEKRIANGTMKLLSKAIQDNHDKVRLWGRYVEFMLRAGVGTPKALIGEIDKLTERKELSELSKTFINALILQVVTNLLFEALRIIISINSSSKKKDRARKFIITMLNGDLLRYLEKDFDTREMKFYEKVSFHQFITVNKAISYIIKDGLLSISKNEDLKAINIEDTLGQNKIITDHDYPSNVWAWWLFNRLPKDSNNIPILRDRIVDELSLLDSRDFNIVLLNPKNIPYKVYRKMGANADFDVLANEAVLFDAYKDIERKKALKIPVFTRIIKKDKKFKNNYTLYDWILWSAIEANSHKAAKNGVPIFDPRLGEWAALEIIRQVAINIKEKNESIEAFINDDSDFMTFVHPHNFKIPSSWIDDGENLTWEKLGNLFGGGKVLVQMRAKENMIIENRFIPAFEENFEPQQSLLYTLGNMLVSLLSKDAILPDKWNPIGFQQAWSELARYKLRNIAVSTYTRTIISSCFSKRNIETRFNLGLPQLNFKIDDDTKFDPPPLKNIDDFISLVNYALDRLKNQQLLVSSQQPRQLTPVSLVQMKKEDFFDMEEKINTVE